MVVVVVVVVVVDVMVVVVMVDVMVVVVVVVKLVVVVVVAARRWWSCFQLDKSPYGSMLYYALGHYPSGSCFVYLRWCLSGSLYDIGFLLFILWKHCAIQIGQNKSLRLIHTTPKKMLLG